MSHRYVTVTVETRAAEHDMCGEKITAIYDLDLAVDGPEIEARFHEDIHDHLLNLLEQHRKDNTE